MNFNIKHWQDKHLITEASYTPAEVKAKAVLLKKFDKQIDKWKKDYDKFVKEAVKIDPQVQGEVLQYVKYWAMTTLNDEYR